ncbi:MAG: UDP-N-acetylmuramoyl-L-alanine--D-glutamate ligase [Succinivibrio sp.]|nr:UDP-N-acetylmuramoyl-L-alanine--D-glutamate ligase [Succinivibrio sp.]
MDKSIENKQVAVIGLGVSNRALIGYVKANSPKRLVLFDTRTGQKTDDPLFEGLEVKLGPLSESELKGFDLVVISPGISIFEPTIAALRQDGVEVVGDIELFARVCQGKVVGITGSNGKSTVTALMGEIARQAGLKVAVGANFGVPVFELLNPEIELYVLELSSFELETCPSLKLTAATCLNVSEDHLDRYHGDIEEYASYKQKIYEHAAYCLYNHDDERTRPHLTSGVCESFGFEGATYALENEGGRLYLCRRGERFIAADELKIYGVHNALNALVCLALSTALGIADAAILAAFRSFTGLAHRCNLVTDIDGVSYYNDSKATNVASTEAALKGLGPVHPEGILLLAGGLGKGQDFSPLKAYLGREVKNILVFGKDADRIMAIDAQRCILVKDMFEALAKAQSLAHRGMAILLSPACASFDQFKGFEDRGAQFVAAVEKFKESSEG